MPSSNSEITSSSCICVSIKSRKKCKSAKRICSSWESAIRDAKNRIEELKFSIRVFEEKKKRGEPWPVISATPLHDAENAATRN